MKKFCLILFVMAPLAVFAQVGQKGSMNISTGADFLLPSAALANNYNAGLGLTLKTEYVFARRTSLTVSGSFYRFPGDKVTDMQLLPVLAGLRFYLGNFYLGAEAGSTFQTKPERQNNFIYSFSAGDEIITGPNGNSLDISLRIQNWNAGDNMRFYGLRIAYEFRIR